jgi:cytochrome c oxidase subunit 2
MRLGRLRFAHVLLAALTLVTLFCLTGCGSLGGPQNTFAPEGDVAKTQRDLFVLVMIPGFIIMVGVFAACIYIMVRFRRRDTDGIPEQVHGNTRLELAWTIAPTILLVAIAIPTLIAIVDLGEAAGPDAMPVTVEAIQWDWTFVYPEIADADGNILEAKDLYIPVDQEVNFSLHAIDVIHSFWVPKLAGKQDVIPGRTNHLKFKAETLGTYSGQCVEFCGLNHAIMTFQTYVVSQEEFDAWAQEQLAAGNSRPPPTAEPTPPGPTPEGTQAPAETPVATP